MYGSTISALYHNEYMRSKSYSVSNVEKQEGEASRSMSFLVATLTKQGAIIGADSRSVRKIEDGSLTVVDDNFQKVFKNDNILIGTWGTNTVSEYGHERPIGVLIEEVLNKSPKNTASVIDCMVSFGDRFSLCGECNFIVFDKRERPYNFKEYVYRNGILSLVNIHFAIPNIIYCNEVSIIPRYTKLDFSVSFSDLQSKIYDIINSVITYGHVLEQNDIVKKYHIGGNVVLQSLTF